MFTINRSGTNSIPEYLATQAARKASMVSNSINENEYVKKAGLQANQYMNNLSNSANQFKNNLHRNLDDNFLVTNSNIPAPNTMFTINRSGTNSIPEYLATQAARKASMVSNSINENEYVKKARDISKPYVDRVKNLDSSNITKENITNIAKEKFDKAKSYMANTFSSKKAMTDEFHSLGDSITNSIKSVPESKRFKVLEKIIKDKVSKLNIGTMKKLSNKDILELTNILTTSKTVKDLKSKVLTYLFTAGKINESTITENMIDVNSDALTDPDTGVVDPSSMSIKDRIANKIKTIRDMNILSALKQNRDGNITNKQESENLEEAIEKKEDSRIQSIVTNVIEKLGLDKEKTKSGDADKDGVRDGSWMSKLKMGKSSNQSTDVGSDIAKKASDDKSGNPMWTIAKLLLMGVPMLISTISGMFGSVDTIMTAVKAFPGFIGKTIGKLSGKIWKGVKWLGGGVLNLGTTIISGVGSFVLDLGKTIGTTIGKLSTDLWDMIKSLGGYMLEMGKSLGNYIGGKLMGAFNSLKSVFGFGDDVVEEVSEMNLPEMDDKGKPKNLDKDGKPIEDDKDKKDIDKDKSKAKVDDIDAKSKKTSWWSKAKGLGKSIVKNPIVRKIPIIGGVIGAGYAVSQLANGDTAGGIGTAISGLVGSIPIVGIPAAYGIDYATEKYKEWNPSIDKKLYSGGNYPSITPDAADQITLNHIRKHETGSADGKYGTAGDIGDGAGISFGAYQFTEKSGNLKEYLKRLVSLTNDPVGQNYISKFEGNMYTGIKSGLITYLKETGDTPAGRYVQDLLYKELFLDPAKKLAASYGITNPASISQIIDHSVNAGLGGAKRMLHIAAGDYTPENIAKSRKLDYMRLINANSKLGKYQNSWFGRVDGNAQMFNIEQHKIGESALIGEKTVTALNTATPPIPGVDINLTKPNGTPAVNSLLSDASKLSTSSQSLGISTPNMVSNQMTSVNTGMTSQPTGVSPVTINTYNIEKLIHESNASLKGIQGNTTTMVSNHAYLVNALKGLTDAILTGKKTVGNISKEIIKTPMGEGVSLAKGDSLK